MKSEKSREQQVLPSLSCFTVYLAGQPGAGTGVCFVEGRSLGLGTILCAADCMDGDRITSVLL